MQSLWENVHHLFIYMCLYPCLSNSNIILDKVGWVLLDQEKPSDPQMPSSDWRDS